MAEPTLQEVFGANATQDATTITINKNDLTGLTPSATNTGESLFVSIIQTARNNLTETNFDNNIDQSVYIEKGLPNYTTRNEVDYRTDSLTINLSKIDLNNVINPNDY